MEFKINKKVFRRFLVSYLIILMLPNLSGYFSYRVAVKEAHASSVENSLLSLKQIIRVMDTRMTEVNAFASQLAINRELVALMTEKASTPDDKVYELWKAARNMSTFSQTNDYLSNFYLYLSNYDVILSPNSVYYRPDHFYEIYGYDGLSLTEWREGILQQRHERDIMPSRSYRSASHRYEVVTYLQTLPLNSFNIPTATLAVLIERDKISKQLETIISQYGGWVYIRTIKGQPILAEGIDQESLDQLQDIPSGEAEDTYTFQDGNLLISLPSDKLGWIYTASIPEEAFTARATAIKERTLTFTILALVCGLAMIVLFTYRNSKPIYTLVQVFREHFGSSGQPPSKNEYDFITGNITRLISSNQELQTELKEQLPMLRDALIKRLLIGELQSIEQIQAESSQAVLGSSVGAGIVGLIQLGGYADVRDVEALQELSVGRLLVKQWLRERLADVITTDWGSDKIAVIIPLPSQGEGEAWKNRLETQLGQLAAAMEQSNQLPLLIALGTRYGQATEISQSFGDATQTLEMAGYHHNAGVFWYDHVLKDKNTYYYPIELEQRLINALKSGFAAESSRLILYILNRNFSERILTFETSRNLLGQLKATLAKLMDQHLLLDEQSTTRIKDKLERLDLSRGVEQLESELHLVIEEVCSVIVQKKEDLNSELVQNIVRQLEQRFAETDLSLYEISKVAGRPEKFVSYIFKESTGDTISDYLERLRLDHANELLKSTDLTIDEIASQSGYNSSHSFRRAFKRVRGVSPSEFRRG